MRLFAKLSIWAVVSVIIIGIEATEPRKLINNIGKVEFYPTFESCGVYFTPPRFDGWMPNHTIPVFYREKGTRKWNRAFDAIFDKNYDTQYRTSVIGLQESTEYEVKIEYRNQQIATGMFRTWSENVPIAREITLTQDDVKSGLVIRDRGTPDGYILYTSKPDVIINANGKSNAILLDNAEYIVVRNLTIRGGTRHAVFLNRCRNVRLINCDIAEWGDPESWKLDRSTGRMRDDQGKVLWNKNGILINRSIGIVIERCYIHDPLLSSNAWRYDHPFGPQGISLDKPQSTVIRFNDICGSDLRWWNDGIAGHANYDLDGGLNRDADVYGNFIAFANDDAIELDGGQQNVRCFQNLIENCFVGVSIQGCMIGPSFVLQNLISYLGDEFGQRSTAIKTTSFLNGTYAASFIYHNTAFDTRSGLVMPSNLRIVAINNILPMIVGSQNHSSWQSSSNLLEETLAGDKDLNGKPGFTAPQKGIFTLGPKSLALGRGEDIPGLNSAGTDLGAPEKLELPLRNFPLSLIKGRRVNFTVKQGQPSGEEKVVARAIGAPVCFKVVTSPDNDWFNVTPDYYTLAANKEIDLIVRLKPERMKGRQNFRGVFFLRTSEGWSRSVTVTARTDSQYSEPIDTPDTKVFKLGAPFAPAERGVKLTGSSIAQFTFEAPHDGWYYALLRARAPGPAGRHDSVYFAVDDAGLLKTFTLIGINEMTFRLTPITKFFLKKGKHTLFLKPREPVNADILVVTGSITDFEHR